MSRLSSFAIFGLLGLVLGSSMGVAAMGGAVNGAYVFGPIGALFGVLVSSLGKTEPDNKTGNNQNVSDKEQELVGQENSSFDAEIGHFSKSVVSLFTGFLVILNSTWNLELLVLEKMGIVPLLLERPWLLPVGILVLLFLFPPVGFLLVITGISAASSGAAVETRFRVLNLRS